MSFGQTDSSLPSAHIYDTVGTTGPGRSEGDKERRPRSEEEGRREKIHKDNIGQSRREDASAAGFGLAAQPRVDNRSRWLNAQFGILHFDFTFVAGNL